LFYTRYYVKIKLGGEYVMKKDYMKPAIDVKEFDVITTIADLSNGGTMGGVGSETGGDSTNWEDA
jgi:hypothetical protein